MPRDWRNARRDQYLNGLGEDEELISKFMGQGPQAADERLRSLTTPIYVGFRKSSLVAFHEYVSILAATTDDYPDQVWTRRAKLLKKAIDLGLGLPG